MHYKNEGDGEKGQKTPRKKKERENSEERRGTDSGPKEYQNHYSKALPTSL